MVLTTKLFLYIMESLDKHNSSSSKIESKEEQRRCLSSNSTGCRCSSLDFNNLTASQEAKLIYLFDTLIEAYIEIKKNELNQKQKSQ
jgi:hypothetical protein